MAGFPSKGTLGNANSKTSTLTLVLTTTQDADVGDIIVVATAWDNINSPTSTGPLDDVLSCADDSGNRYMTGAAAQNASTGSGQGAHVAIFVAEVTSFLASGSSITVTTQNAARTAKAISAELFGNDDYNHFRICERTSVNDTAVDPSSLTLSSLPTDVPVLLIHALAGEGPQADAYTWDSDYTQFVGDGSTGGAANTNMHLRAGYRELSGSSSDTVDVTSTTADRDYSQVFLGLIGYDVAPYPSTPLLDDFNRANETPLSGGGNWDTTGYGTASAAQLISNAAGNSAAVQNKQSTWAASFGGDVESWATFSADGGGNQRIIAAATTDRGTSTFDNYSLLWGVSPTFCLRLNRVDDSVLTLIGLTAPPVVGWKVGLRVTNGYVEVWTNQTDGWRCALVATDATYSGGQIGFGIASASIGGTNRRFDDFGGGGADVDLVPPPIGIALETDVAYPLNGANEDSSGTGAAADTIDVPGSPGTLTITGLPFEPTWVFIVASDATADDTWQSGTSCMSRGLGGMDPGGSLFQTVTRMVFDATTQVASGYDEGHIIEVASARGAMGANLLVKATLTGFTADGFTLSFSNVTANMKFHYLAGDQAAALSDISFATLAGLTWDNTPAGGIYLGLSDAASSSVPRNWNGGAYTAQIGAGRIAVENESPESDFIWWDPGYNTTQHFNGIDGPVNDWAGIFNDIWFFGSVLRRPMQMFRVANDVLIRDAGAWVASLLVLADTYAQATSGDAGDSVSDVADITWADPDFTPAALVHIQGSTVGFAAEDPDHTGASIGVATKDNMWVVALSSKHGFGASIYRSDALSWISAWDPHDAPTDMSAGTSIPILNGARVTTVVADVPTNMHVGVAGLGQGVVFGPISMNWRYAIRKGVATRALFNDEISPGS